LAIRKSTDTTDITKYLQPQLDISDEIHADEIEILFNRIILTFGVVQNHITNITNNITEIQQKIDGGGGGGTPVANYSCLEFTTSDWVESNNNKKALTITPSAHGLGTQVSIAAVLCKAEDGTWSESIVTYKVYVDGTVKVFADIAFSGKLVINQIS
jgi:hypothetical protein